MRENCTSGSVRGASGNRGSYRKSAIQYRYSESVMVLNEKVEKLRQVIAHLGISFCYLKTTDFNIWRWV